MNNNNVDLKDLLLNEAYQARGYRNIKFYKEFEALTRFGFSNVELFDELKRTHKKIPSQTLYVEEGTERAINFFKERPTHNLKKLNCTHTFVINNQLIAAIENRLARSYTSFLIEEQVAEYVAKHYNSRIISNALIDQTFGADLVLINYNTFIYYVHIAKASQFSRNMITEKGNTNATIYKNNKRYTWARNWRAGGHSLLLYNTNVTDRMINVNGNLLFNEAYLKLYFKKLFVSKHADHRNPSEIYQFCKFIEDNNLA